MSLNWNIIKVKDYDKIDEEKLRGVLNTLIYCTMIVGMGEISEDPENKCYYKRFHARLDFVQKLNGPFLHKTITNEDGSFKEEETLLTEDMVKRFVGLKCNVTYETPSAWLKRFTVNDKRHF